MKVVYLIRHSKPNNKEKCIDISLSDEGVELAKQLKNKLPKIEKIYSSNLKRAVQTAKILSENVVEDKRLNERIVGTEFMTKEDWEKQYKDVNYKLTNGESFLEVSNRMSSFINEKLEKEIYVVSHAAAICAYLIQFCKIEVVDSENKLRKIEFNSKVILNGKINTPSIFKITYDDFNKIIDVEYI